MPFCGNELFLRRRMKRVQKIIHLFMTVVFMVAVLFSATGMDMTVAESVSVTDVADVESCTCCSVNTSGAGTVSAKVYGKSSRFLKLFKYRSFCRDNSEPLSNVSIRVHAARYSLSYNHLFCTFLI